MANKKQEIKRQELNEFGDDYVKFSKGNMSYTYLVEEGSIDVFVMDGTTPLFDKSFDDIESAEKFIVSELGK